MSKNGKKSDHAAQFGLVRLNFCFLAGWRSGRMRLVNIAGRENFLTLFTLTFCSASRWKTVQF